MLLSGTSSQPDTGRQAPRLPTRVLVPPQVTLASLRGKPAAINFWASWCAPCKKEAPDLERLAGLLRGRARLVGVNWSDGASDARSYVDQYHLTFPNLIDPDGVTGDHYRLNGLPTTFILDAQGNRNRFDFSNPTVNTPVSAGEFTFTPPQGTQIIHP